MMEESTITVGSGFTSFVGPDATNLFRAMTLKSALGLLSHGISPTRGLTMTKALKMVEYYSGQKYKRTEVARAIADLTTWIETMKSAIPIERK